MLYARHSIRHITYYSRAVYILFSFIFVCLALKTEKHNIDLEFSHSIIIIIIFVVLAVLNTRRVYTHSHSSHGCHLCRAQNRPFVYVSVIQYVSSIRHMKTTTKLYSKIQKQMAQWVRNANIIMYPSRQHTYARSPHMQHTRTRPLTRTKDFSLAGVCVRARYTAFERLMCTTDERTVLFFVFFFYLPCGCMVRVRTCTDEEKKRNDRKSRRRKKRITTRKKKLFQYSCIEQTL